VKTIKSEWEKRLYRNIRAIQKAERDLRAMGLHIEIAHDVEGMLAQVNDHVYIMDYAGKQVVLQKYLFSVPERGAK